MNTLRLIALALILQAASAQLAPSSVSGIAVKAGSLEPLSDVVVKLERIDGSTPAIGTPRCWRKRYRYLHRFEANG
jgi:hypothetical protein